MTEVKFPEKIYNPESKEFWDALDRGRVVFQYCLECQRWQHYPRILCSECWGSNLVWESVEGTSVVLSFTDVLKPGHPAFLEMVPYRLLIVKLSEGPTLLVRAAENFLPEVGQTIRLVPRKTPSGILLIGEP